ncbi:RNA polymerase sigma factor [Sphingobacterium daejeonense]|uniref:RNA polymerase sigma factor n=1 Tax=Sphingobacterium daejeonense TaxID=371142 RepID=UPI003D313479
MSEVNLIYKFRAADPDAFREVYNRYFDEVYKFCFFFAKEEEAAKDLAHDTFVLLWQNCDLLDPDQGIKPYLLTVARNAVHRWHKTQARDILFKEELKDRFQYRQDNVRQDLVSDASLDLAHVKSFLNTFPAKRRKVFEMVRFDDLSYSEVAEKLCISRDAVKDHMVKANRSLRKFRDEGEISFEFLLAAMIFLY